MIPVKRQRLQSLLNQPEVLVRQLQSLVATDELFAQNPEVAYDLGWALTFYLSERLPSEFRQYTTLLAARPYGDYTAFERTMDFRQVFGGDLSLLAVQISRLLQQ